MPSAGGGARNVLKRLHGVARGAAEGAVGAGRKQGEQQERGSRRETPSMRRAGIAEWKEIGKCYEEIAEVSERERGGSRVERRERER